ncbi:hypothetical protein, partial [Aeromonas allosaccharophila]
EGKLMTHDEPCSMAPDDKHDLISGTCSHLPKTIYSSFRVTSKIRQLKAINSKTPTIWGFAIANKPSADRLSDT